MLSFFKSVFLGQPSDNALAVYRMYKQEEASKQAVKRFAEDTALYAEQAAQDPTSRNFGNKDVRMDN